MRTKQFASLVVILLGVLAVGLISGCSSDGSGNVYDWRGSYMCTMSELTDAQQAVIRIVDGTLQLRECQSSGLGTRAAEPCHFWANVEGAGALAMSGTFTERGGEITCDLVPQTAAQMSPLAAESINIVVEGNGQTGEGTITLVDDGVTYTGTIEIEQYPED